VIIYNACIVYYILNVLSIKLFIKPVTALTYHTTAFVIRAKLQHAKTISNNLTYSKFVYISNVEMAYCSFVVFIYTLYFIIYFYSRAKFLLRISIKLYKNKNLRRNTTVYKMICFKILIFKIVTITKKNS